MRSSEGVERGNVWGVVSGLVLAVFLVVLVAAGVLSMSGCESPRTTSPISKRPVTAEELQAEVVVWQEDREAKAKADIEDDAKAMREAVAQSKRDAAKAKRDAERKLRALDANAVEVREELLDVLAQLEQDFTLRTDSIQAGARTRLENDAATERSMQAKADAAVADLNRQVEQRGAIWKLARGGAQIAGTFVPGAQPAISAAEALLGTTGLVGLVGTTVSRIQLGRKKQELAAESERADKVEMEREEAKRKHEADLVAMEKVVSSLDHLKDVKPELSTILKAVDAGGRLILDEWQGPDGKALVNKLQQHATA